MYKRQGQAVRQQIELARESTARLVGGEPRDVILTSGGTEAAVMALRGTLAARPRRRLLVTSLVEHGAVRELARDLERRERAEVHWLPVDGDGVFDADALARTLDTRRDDVALVSVMWANNETGVIQPIESIAATCREMEVPFHCDATQWVGRMPVDLGETPIDLLSFAAHKFHGPKGVGVLVSRPGVRLAPQAVGHQERDRRAGTENVAGIIGLGVAADEAALWLSTDGRETLAAERDRLERALVAAIRDARVNGVGAPRTWTTTNIAFPGCDAEAVLSLIHI